MCGTQAQEDTLAALNRAIEQNPQDNRAIARRGETCRLAGRYEEALADFSRAIALQPDYAWAIAHRGETYYLLKRYREALADFNRAVELQPTYVWALAHRGVTYRFMGRRYYEKALADFSRAVEIKPDYTWALAYRCLVAELMGRYEEALADFDRVVALDPTTFTPWRSKRGLMLSYDGRYAEAIEHCEQALKENPHDHLALYCKAVAKTRWQGLAEARTEIDRARVALQAVFSESGRDDALYRLGSLAALEGKTEEALALLQEAIPLEGEALDLARHDMAWLDLRTDSRFQSLIAEPAEL